MKQVQPAQIALAATIPVAFFVLWYLYRKHTKKSSNLETITTAPESTKENKCVADVGLPSIIDDSDNEEDVYPPTPDIDKTETEEEAIDTSSICQEKKDDSNCSLSIHLLDNNNEAVESSVAVKKEVNEEVNDFTDVEKPNPKTDQELSTPPNSSEGRSNKNDTSLFSNADTSKMSSLNLPGGGDAPQFVPMSNNASGQSTISEMTESDEESQEMMQEEDTLNNAMIVVDNAITDSVLQHMSLQISDAKDIAHDTVLRDEKSQIKEEEDNSKSETAALPEVAITSDSKINTSALKKVSDAQRLDSYTPSSLSSMESDNLEEGDLLTAKPEFEKMQMTSTLHDRSVIEVSEESYLQSSDEHMENGSLLGNKNNNNNMKDSVAENGEESTEVCDASFNNDSSQNEVFHEDNQQDNKPKPNLNGLVHHKPPYANRRSGSYDNFEEEQTQLYVEFPSEKVGLLIGKQGRNIKTLKHETGADIMVHAVPFRDDIQVLQIIGSPTSVQLAVSKIQRRFREVKLTEYEDVSLMNLSSTNLISPTASLISPLESPSSPTFAYPVPDMSQLRLPDGISVEVIVSAIANCECIFVQQYTHPTFHALASLEQAMASCYASPSTPALLSPVQVGLICAAQHQNIWYRAQVMHSEEDSSEITIKFVDYGGYSTVPISTVKQIRADFITLPFQAAECFLDNIAPPEGEDLYSIESTTVLQEMLKEGSFNAAITRYRSDGLPLIHLYKRNKNQVELVNKLLVSEGIARWCDHNKDSMGTLLADK